MRNFDFLNELYCESVSRRTNSNISRERVLEELAAEEAVVAANMAALTARLEEIELLKKEQEAFEQALEDRELDWIAEAWDNNKCVVIISAELLPDNKVEFYGYHEDMEVTQSIIVAREEKKYTNTTSLVVYKEVVYRYINVYKTESGVIVKDCYEEHSPVYRKCILSKEDYQKFVKANPLPPPPVVKETYKREQSLLQENTFLLIS